jgi:hypothetical protein
LNIAQSLSLSREEIWFAFLELVWTTALLSSSEMEEMLLLAFLEL